MSQIQHTPESPHGSFQDFLFRNKGNKSYLYIAAVAILIQLTIFKYFYPYAGFILQDSYAYLLSAFWNDSIGIYPVGYPQFLRFFSVFTRSDTILVAFQYVLLEISSLFFVFTIFYTYRCRRLTKNLVFGFAVFNPVNLYIANYISSDSVFAALSLIWFTLLIWIVLKPSVHLLMLQAIVIFLAFTVRYNALYYPIISIAVILFSRQKPLHKLSGILTIVLTIGLFIWYTTQKYYELTGIRQFSPFSGWQIANNAINGYRYIEKVDRKPVPEQFKKLDQITRKYIDSTHRNILVNLQELQLGTTYYMWKTPSPLQQYMLKAFHTRDTVFNLKRWASMGPLYSAYGLFLMRQYPSEYKSSFLIPNVAKFCAPPLEFLEAYNMGQDTVAGIATAWFHYKSNRVSVRLNDFKARVLVFYPILIGCVNFLFITSFLCFMILKGYNIKPFIRLLSLAGNFLIINFCFSVFSAPVYARHQIFPTLVSLVFASIMIEYVCNAAFTPAKLSSSVHTTADNLSMPG